MRLTLLGLLTSGLNELLAVAGRLSVEAIRMALGSEFVKTLLQALLEIFWRRLIANESLIQFVLTAAIPLANGAAVDPKPCASQDLYVL